MAWLMSTPSSVVASVRAHDVAVVSMASSSVMAAFGVNDRWNGLIS